MRTFGTDSVLKCLNQPIEVWAKAAGLEWSAVKVPALADISSTEHFLKNPHTERNQSVEGQCFIVRSDTAHVLGYASDGYQPVQPSEVLGWFEQYVSVNSRFHIDTAGSLKSGEIIWAMAKFQDLEIVGEKHVAQLLMTTTFDCSGATINKATLTRVVCNNTLDAAMADGGKSIIRTRHNTAFNAQRVGKELATIAQGFESYRLMAEAMYNVSMSKEQISNFFKSCLDIPFDAKKDVSTRKLNQLSTLQDCYRDTIGEGTKPQTQWAALNSITRYVDHERSVRTGANDVSEARVLSAQFGSGAALKQKAIGLLLAA